MLSSNDVARELDAYWTKVANTGTPEEARARLAQGLGNTIVESDRITLIESKIFAIETTIRAISPLTAVPGAGGAIAAVISNLKAEAVRLRSQL